MNEPLPELLDAKALRAELGVTRAAAEAIMRRLPVVQIEGLRKVYVPPRRRRRLPRGADLREGSCGAMIGRTRQMGGHRANGPAPAPKELASMRIHPIARPFAGARADG